MIEQWCSHDWNGKTNRLGEKFPQMQCHLSHHTLHPLGQNTEQLATNCMSTGTAYLLMIRVSLVHTQFRKGLLTISILSHWGVAVHKIS
jgi:hypothetical protein